MADTPSSIHPPTAGTYRIEPGRSSVSYSGRHMFGLGVVHAAFTVESGEITASEGLAGSTAVVTVDAASFTSNSSKRDRDVRSSLLDVDTYPTIGFTSGRLREEGPAWVLPGTVTAHGANAAVELVVDRIEQQGVDVHVVAHARRLDRYAFGVVRGKGMVGRYLDLDLDVVAVPA